MWIALAHGNADGTAVEQVLPSLEALVQFTDGLERRFAEDGLHGLAATVALAHRLRDAVREIPSTDVARAQEDVRRLAGWFGELAHALEDLRRLKAAVADRA